MLEISEQIEVSCFAPEFVDVVDLILDLEGVAVESSWDDALVHNIATSESTVSQDVKQHVRSCLLPLEELHHKVEQDSQCLAFQ